MDTNIRYCTATSKRTHKPCRARAMRGMQVCYHHGGRSLRGESHPNFKHGFYSTEPFVRVLWALIEYRYRQAQINARLTTLYAGQIELLLTSRNWPQLRVLIREIVGQPYPAIPRERATELWRGRYKA